MTNEYFAIWVVLKDGREGWYQYSADDYTYEPTAYIGEFPHPDNVSPRPFTDGYMDYMLHEAGSNVASATVKPVRLEVVND